LIFFEKSNPKFYKNKRKNLLMKAEIELRLIVKEDIYEIIKRRIITMKEERHVLVIEVLLNFIDYNTIDIISWKFDDEACIKKY
jgi:hypothetical protein